MAFSRVSPEGSPSSGRAAVSLRVSQTGPLASLAPPTQLSPPHPGSSRGRQRHFALGPADVRLAEQIETGWRAARDRPPLLRLPAGPAQREHPEPEGRRTEQGPGDQLHGLSPLCTSASPARRRGVVDLLTEGSASPWGALCCSRPRKPETQAPLRPFCARELARWGPPLTWGAGPFLTGPGVPPFSPSHPTPGGRVNLSTQHDIS